jgi:hypothetical protein
MKRDLAREILQGLLLTNIKFKCTKYTSGSSHEESSGWLAGIITLVSVPYRQNINQRGIALSRDF